MTIQKPSTKTKSTGYFKVSRNGEPFFLSDRVMTYRSGEYIVIEGAEKWGTAEARGFILTIHQDTPSGQQDYDRDDTKSLRSVEYYNHSGVGEPGGYAQTGQFDAKLDNVTKKHHITFKLKFAPIGEVEGELEVAE